MLTLPSGRFIHRVILLRLFLGWLFLSSTLGTGILFWEINRIQQFVHELALKESLMFSVGAIHNLDNIDDKEREFMFRLANQLVDQHFLVVELYNRDKQLKLEAVHHGRESSESLIDHFRHQFPRADGFTREFHFIEGQLCLVILVPLISENALIGYFEGVYQVDHETFSKIKQDIWRTLIFVTLGISFTCLLMYPIVLTLNRGIIKLSRELLQGNLELMDALGCAIAERDVETNSHNYRVTYYSLRLGEAIGLPSEHLCNLIAGAFLHDVGKIGIRDPILLKPEKLTAEEFEIMKTHVLLGVDILNKSNWLSGARDVVEFHHEKYDGSGYLQGLEAEAIPLHARIFTIADVFDALTSKRPYKEPWSVPDAITKLEKDSGNHFDPNLLSVFIPMAPLLYKEIHSLDEQQLELMLHRIIGQYFLVTDWEKSGK